MHDEKNDPTIIVPLYINFIITVDIFKKFTAAKM